MSQDNINQEAVIASIEALMEGYEPKFAETYSRELLGIICDEGEDFMLRTKLIQSWVDKHEACLELEDVLFDLLLVHYLSAEPHQDNYFDSEDWNRIEEKTLDQGSEMLNLFLYLGEAKENEVEVSLEDFLTEFLLVGEDEFQDEYRIYESLIVNQDLLHADIDSLLAIKAKIKVETGIKELFIPIVLFFQNLEEGEDMAKEIAGISKFEKSILSSLIAYHTV